MSESEALGIGIMYLAAITILAAVWMICEITPKTVNRIGMIISEKIRKLTLPGKGFFSKIDDFFYRLLGGK